MTKEEAKELLPIITAYSEGKIIEVKGTDDIWREAYCPNFDTCPKLYRVKQEPKYRPFKNAKECWNEIEKHSHFGWIKFKGEEERYIHCEGIEDRGIFYNDSRWTFENMIDDLTFIDGSPFGIKEE